MTKARDVSGAPDVVIASGTFNGVTAINFTNVLSNTYRFYTLNFYVDCASGGSNIIFRFRENTTDKTSGYFAGGGYANDTGSVGTRGQQSNSSSLYFGTSTTVYSSFVNATIYRPSATAGAITYQMYDDYLSSLQNYAGYNGAMTNFTGFSISTTPQMEGYYLLTGRRV